MPGKDRTRRRLGSPEEIRRPEKAQKIKRGEPPDTGGHMTEDGEERNI